MAAVEPVAPVDRALRVSPPREKAPIRRMELADINFHAPWLLPRMTEVFYWLSQQQIMGWLKNAVYSPDYMVLFQENAVACATLTRAVQLEPIPIVQERFAFVRDPKNKDQLRDALEVYTELVRWATNSGATTIILSDKSDLPLELIRSRFGRVFDRILHYVKIEDDQN
jgi:hypothetical protein